MGLGRPGEPARFSIRRLPVAFAAGVAGLVDRGDERLAVGRDGGLELFDREAVRLDARRRTRPGDVEACRGRDAQVAAEASRRPGIRAAMWKSRSTSAT